MTADATPPVTTSAASSARKRWGVLVLVGGGTLILLFLGIWLFSPVHVDESVPGTVKTEGTVYLRRGGEGEAAAVKALGTIRSGDTLEVREGDVALVLLQGGVMARVEGPAELQLWESQRKVDAPSILQGLLGQRFGIDPVGDTQITTSVGLRVVSGAVAVKTGSLTSNAVVKLEAGNLYGRIEGSTVMVALAPEEVVWDSLEGGPVVGMVSGAPGEEAPVVVPKSPAGLRLIIRYSPAVPESPDFMRLTVSMRAMVDQIRQGVPGLEAEGVQYQEFTDPSGLAYLASPGPGQPEMEQKVLAQEAELPSPEEAIAVPGLEVRVLTDADIQGYLPAGTTVRLLPGNTVHLLVAGLSYRVRAAVVGGRLELQGLPLGIDPAAYFSELPFLLSLETDEGIARVTYLPEEPPPPPQETAAEQIAQEGALPHTSPYFSAIPTPLQVSLDWNVATTNLLIIALLALVLRISVASSTHILGAHEAVLKHHLDPILRHWRPIADTSIKLLHRIPHLMTTIAGNIIFLLILNGALFALLDLRFQPWAGVGLQVFPLMLLGTAVAYMVDPVVRARVLNRWGAPHHFGFNAANLFLGVVCVTGSRLLHLSPGLFLGSAGGLRTPTLKTLPLAQRSRLVMAGIIGTAVVGLVAWFATLLLPLAASSPLSAGLFQLFRGPLSIIQDIFLLAFTVCLTRVFFLLLPVPNSPGLTVASKNLVGWAASFLISGFLFFHLILNKNTGITKLLQERGYLLVPLVLLSLAATMVLHFVSKAMTNKAAAAAKS